MEEGSQKRKRTKGHKEESLSLFRDRKALELFETIFSKCHFIVEHNMDVEVIHTIEVYEQMRAHGPYLDLQWLIQDEEVQIFYSNVFGENNRDNSFYSTVYGCPITVYPNYMAKLLYIPWEAEGILFLDQDDWSSLYPARQLGHKAPSPVL